MKNKRYTAEEKELILSGKYSVAELSQMLGREKCSIIAVRYSVKIGKSSNKKHAWTKEELELLKNMKYSVSELSERLKVSECAIRSKMSQKCIRRTESQSKIYIDKETKIIFMRASGKTIKEISDITGVTYNSVKYVCSKNGMIRNLNN